MTERLVLYPPTALVETLVGQAYQVERVGDLDGVGQHGVEHGPIRPRQIQRGPYNPAPPAGSPAGQPGARPSNSPAFDDIEEPAASDVDDRGRPVLTSVRA